MPKIMSLASKVASLPGLSLVSPAATRAPSVADQEGYLTSQRLAMTAARAVPMAK